MMKYTALLAVITLAGCVPSLDDTCRNNDDCPNIGDYCQDDYCVAQPCQGNTQCREENAACSPCRTGAACYQTWCAPEEDGTNASDGTTPERDTTVRDSTVPQQDAESRDATTAPPDAEERDAVGTDTSTHDAGATDATPPDAHLVRDAMSQDADPCAEFVRAEISCGVGACRRTITTTCGGDNNCIPGEAAANDDSCNTVDDDCDGEIDEDFPEQETQCGMGVCAAMGRIVCQDGRETNTCQPREAASDEVCDGVDNDCDGNIDEGFAGEQMSCGMGPCTHTVTLCEDGAETVCDPLQGAVEERCDGIDNDCDGTVDNIANGSCVCEPDVREVCYPFAAETRHVGQCNDGDRQCMNGGRSWEVCRGATGPAPERCDDIDNDCDGAVDEDFNLGSECTVGVGMCARAGTLLCDPENNRNARCSAVAGQPEAERCDGIDNDCDGEVDEDFEVGGPCSTGIGACERPGVWSCPIDGDTLFCNAEPGDPQLEVCNHQDDDCDGEVDELDDGGTCLCYQDDPLPCYNGPGGMPDADGRCFDNELNEIPCTVGIGICRAGQIPCLDGGRTLGTCEGDILPQLERCDDEDNDCNGITDDAPIACECRSGDTTPCFDGRDDQIDVGPCRTGIATCQEGHWSICEGQVLPTDEICDLVDNDCNGRVDDGGEAEELTTSCYTGPEGTEGVGSCHAGMATCVDGAWGACVGEQLPQETDVCDGFDEDCNGTADDGGTGTILTRACYTGPEGTENRGPCHGGRSTCLGIAGYGPCDGEVTPVPELCRDGIDNNCNGLLDGGNISVGGNMRRDPDCNDCQAVAETMQQGTCADGRDNDCDFQVDAADPNCRP